MAMKINQLVARSMRKNIKNYFLYFFALIFSVALFFAFVTLQTNPVVDIYTEVSTRADTGFKVASYLLLFIVTLFVIYANSLFIKQRSKEIGLYQLIGMPKTMIARMLSIENFLLWLAAIVIGSFFGFIATRFFAMILLKIIQINDVTQINFSWNAIFQTVIVFGILYIITMIQAFWKINKSSLLTLFQESKKQEVHVKQIGILQMSIGLMGIVLIILGYFYSTKLFTVESTSGLLGRMVFILASTIGGTYLVFRFSVAFILNTLRKIKRGHLSLYDVLAAAPIMHRMKGNAKSLTLITVLTGVALAILSLSYISYYSIDSNVEARAPFEYQTYNSNYKDLESDFNKAGIEVEKYEVDVLQGETKFLNAMVTPNKFSKMYTDTKIVSQTSARIIDPEINLHGTEVELLGYTEAYDALSPMKKGGVIQIKMTKGSAKYTINNFNQKTIIPSDLSKGAFTLVVSDKQWNKLAQSSRIQEFTKFKKFTGYNLIDKSQKKEATEIYYAKTNDGIVKSKEMGTNGTQLLSKEDIKKDLQGSIGLTIFITGFLGLVFLLATGSILYFKQMAEAEDEKTSYNTLRKIGFTKNEIMKGIYVKQIFSFGLPLLIGLLHSYFAVKSGWTFFGSEITTPLIIVMGIYTILYIVFAILSSFYYKKVVNDSL